MTVFGDAEPEDAYDASDPVAVQLDNLARRLEATEARRVAGPDSLRIDLIMRHLAQAADRIRADG